MTTSTITAEYPIDSRSVEFHPRIKAIALMIGKAITCSDVYSEQEASEIAHAIASKDFAKVLEITDSLNRINLSSEIIRDDKISKYIPVWSISSNFIKEYEGKGGLLYLIEPENLPKLSTIIDELQLKYISNELSKDEKIAYVKLLETLFYISYCQQSSTGQDIPTRNQCTEPNDNIFTGQNIIPSRFKHGRGGLQGLAFRSGRYLSYIASSNDSENLPLGRLRDELLDNTKDTIETINSFVLRKVLGDSANSMIQDIKEILENEELLELFHETKVNILEEIDAYNNKEIVKANPTNIEWDPTVDFLTADLSEIDIFQNPSSPTDLYSPTETNNEDTDRVRLDYDRIKFLRELGILIIESGRNASLFRSFSLGNSRRSVHDRYFCLSVEHPEDPTKTIAIADNPVMRHNAIYVVDEACTKIDPDSGITYEWKDVIGCGNKRDAYEMGAYILYHSGNWKDDIIKIVQNGLEHRVSRPIVVSALDAPENEEDTIIDLTTSNNDEATKDDTESPSEPSLQDEIKDKEPEQEIEEEINLVNEVLNDIARLKNERDQLKREVEEATATNLELVRQKEIALNRQKEIERMHAEEIKKIQEDSEAKSKEDKKRIEVLEAQRDSLQKSLKNIIDALN